MATYGTEYGFRTDKMIEEIVQGINSFPAQPEFGRPGDVRHQAHYHQRQAFYRQIRKQRRRRIG